ncbi:MAG: hypothetical protein NXH85_02310 [Pseudomonadaceae bacterium]|nr:hypothetical protein [Pseudomonadaceae bacterium]
MSNVSDWIEKLAKAGPLIADNVHGNVHGLVAAKSKITLAVRDDAVFLKVTNAAKADAWSGCALFGTEIYGKPVLVGEICPDNRTRLPIVVSVEDEDSNTVKFQLGGAPLRALSGAQVGDGDWTAGP